MGRFNFCDGEKAQRNNYREILINLFQKKMVVLDIVDEYQYLDNELIEMLTVSIEPYLKEFI